MIINNEPFLIEYNVRMGDPECQTILPKIKTDLLEIFLACCEKKLNKVDINWLDKKSLCIVVCSKGYPDKFKKDVEIKDIKDIHLGPNEYVFHAGTAKNKEKIYATGGRVLNFVSVSDDFGQSRKEIIKIINELNWVGGFFRKDIGHKVIN